MFVSNEALVPPYVYSQEDHVHDKALIYLFCDKIRLCNPSNMSFRNMIY